MFIPPGAPNRIRAGYDSRFGANARARVKSVDVERQRRRSTSPRARRVRGESREIENVCTVRRGFSDRRLSASLAPFVGEQRRRVAIGALMRKRERERKCI